MSETESFEVSYIYIDLSEEFEKYLDELLVWHIQCHITLIKQWGILSPMIFNIYVDQCNTVLLDVVLILFIYIMHYPP